MHPVNSPDPPDAALLAPWAEMLLSRVSDLTERAASLAFRKPEFMQIRPTDTSAWHPLRTVAHAYAFPQRHLFWLFLRFLDDPARRSIASFTIRSGVLVLRWLTSLVFFGFGAAGLDILVLQGRTLKATSPGQYLLLAAIALATILLHLAPFFFSLRELVLSLRGKWYLILAQAVFLALLLVGFSLSVTLLQLSSTTEAGQPGGPSLDNLVTKWPTTLALYSLFLVPSAAFWLNFLIDLIGVAFKVTARAYLSVIFYIANVLDPETAREARRLASEPIPAHPPANGPWRLSDLDAAELGAIVQRTDGLLRATERRLYVASLVVAITAILLNIPELWALLLRVLTSMYAFTVGWSLEVARLSATQSPSEFLTSFALFVLGATTRMFLGSTGLTLILSHPFVFMYFADRLVRNLVIQTLMLDACFLAGHPSSPTTPDHPPARRPAAVLSAAFLGLLSCLFLYRTVRHLERRPASARPGPRSSARQAHREPID